MTCCKEFPYKDIIIPYAKAIFKANPERVVRATDWPHPYIHLPMPDGGDLQDLPDSWASGAETRKRILGDSPAKLYDFEVRSHLSYTGLPED